MKINILRKIEMKLINLGYKEKQYICKMNLMIQLNNQKILEQ